MSELKPFLPQNDPDVDARKADLQHEQSRFRYSAHPEFLEKLGDTFQDLRFPMLQTPPPKDVNFSGEYIIKRTVHSAPLLTNQLLVRARGFLDPLDKLEDYDDCFIRIPAPPIVKSYQDDEAFAEQRLSGVNPVTLTLLTRSGKTVKYTDVLERITVPAQAKKAQAALDTGCCFIVDYTGADAAYEGPQLVEVSYKYSHGMHACKIVSVLR